MWFICMFAVLKYWMILVLMGYDYVEPCTGQYNYSKLEGCLNTTTKRNADLWLSPRHSLSWIPGCATDATVISQASHFLHLSCKRGKQYFSFSLLYFVCLTCQSRSFHAMMEITKLPQRYIQREAADQAVTPMAYKVNHTVPSGAAGWNCQVEHHFVWDRKRASDMGSQLCANCWTVGYFKNM